MSPQLRNVQSTLRSESVKGLQKSLGAWRSMGVVASEPVNAETAKRPVYTLSLDEIVDLYEEIESGNIPLSEVAWNIRVQEEQLLACIMGRLPQELADRQTWGVRLVAYVSGLFVPSVAHLGEYTLAVQIVHQLVQRILGKPFENVVGANAHSIPDSFVKGGTASTDASLTFRYLLLAPLFTALSAHYPMPG